MATITFDTLKFVRKLRESGFEEKQAEGIADAFKEASSEADFATKRDIERLEGLMREIEQRMTIKLGGMLMAGIAIVATLVKLL